MSQEQKTYVCPQCGKEMTRVIKTGLGFELHREDFCPTCRLGIPPTPMTRLYDDVRLHPETIRLAAERLAAVCVNLSEVVGALPACSYRSSLMDAMPPIVRLSEEMAALAAREE